MDILFNIYGFALSAARNTIIIISNIVVITANEQNCIKKTDTVCRGCWSREGELHRNLLMVMFR